MSPTVLREGGFRFYFFSREEPRAHVHVYCGDGEAKFWLEPAIELAQNYGLDDPQLRLAEEVIRTHPQSKKLWKEHSMATLRKNKKLHRTILQGMRPVEIRSDAGIYLGRRTGFLFPVEVYEGVMERTARGLFYHHFGEILGAQVQCEVSFLRSLDADFLEMSANWPTADIGAGAFVYRYTRSADAPLNSAWIFQFYEAHWALVEIEPVCAAEL